MRTRPVHTRPTMRRFHAWSIAIAVLVAVVMVVYTVLREFFGVSAGAEAEKAFFDAVMVGAVVLVVLNRKFGKDPEKPQAGEE